MKRGCHDLCTGTATSKRRRDVKYPADAISRLMWAGRSIWKNSLTTDARNNVAQTTTTIKCSHCERSIRPGREMQCVECLNTYCDECATIKYVRWPRSLATVFFIMQVN
ncbi:hypothetical protein, variant [Aphanomyces astaci]|uniref:Uncharacterized protein n=1 Tax=Aphanomyces astaci TaxID=112090 RepID=W4G2P1_APHAT|nr:hypothetical protein, variant [Aphanomyces astaci]ETV73314.1 hypothetical protein, variant [Aphanomyces astaci]|eukprot:XP_009837188.1 hypothetical protein, variant [Aphanomyces astaci]